MQDSLWAAALPGYVSTVYQRANRVWKARKVRPVEVRKNEDGDLIVILDPVDRSEAEAQGLSEVEYAKKLLSEDPNLAPLAEFVSAESDKGDASVTVEEPALR
jgi:hypothetical protein